MPDRAHSLGPLQEVLEKRLKRERSARKQAEQILEAKSEELYSTNCALQDAHSELETKLCQLEIERDLVVQMSKTDLLTQVANRGAMFTEIERAMLAERDPDKDVWLFLLDLVHFRHLNAALGRVLGDEVLRMVAARLNDVTEEWSGKVARFGGTQFGCLIELATTEIEVFQTALADALSTSFVCGDREMQLRLAIGAAGTNLVQLSPDRLVTAADFALSKSRANDELPSIVFNPAHQAELKRGRELQGLLRHAVEAHEIEPWFQPIIYPGKSTKVSLEVLARWPQTGGMFSPGEFIPMAEEMGVRRQLDRNLLRTALEQTQPWVTGGAVQDVSVNVLPIDLMAPDFVEEMTSILRETDFPTDHLIVEVTETLFIEDLKYATEQLSKLRALGIGVALDDFGTGFSNLRSLVGLPLSRIKLDQSLIADMAENHRISMLVSSFIQWARASDLSIVAEGVETDAQASLLRSLGCTCLQGFLFGRAMSAKQFESRVASFQTMAA